METQNKLIAQHLESGHTITALEALHRFGCFRLSARIWDLKRQGMAIEGTWKTVKSLAGEDKQIVEYKLKN